MSDLYKAAVGMFIRPPRAEYFVSDMGPKEFDFIGRGWEREDIRLCNSRGLWIECSHFYPVKTERRNHLPCVIYLHGNCGCRMDALEVLPFLLVHDISLFCFDFSGSGLSQGEYISLGYYEQQDVDLVIRHLKTKEFISRICLWGASMGAATALMYTGGGHADERIQCLVLDSPFASLIRLAKEVVKSQETSMPRWLFKSAANVGLKMIRSSIRKQTQFDINDNEPLVPAAKCRVPALFMHALGDQVIPVQHSRDLLAVYGGNPKQLLELDGDHNTLRPARVFDQISEFLHTHLLTDSDRRFVPLPIKAFGNTAATKNELNVTCFLCQQVDEPDSSLGPPCDIVLVCLSVEGLTLRAPWTEVELRHFRWYEISRYFVTQIDPLLCFEYQLPRECGRVVFWTLEAQAICDEIKLLLRRVKKAHKQPTGSAIELRWQERENERRTSSPKRASLAVPSPSTSGISFSSNIAPAASPSIPVVPARGDAARSSTDGRKHKKQHQDKKEKTKHKKSGKERKEKKEKKKEKKHKHSSTTGDAEPSKAKGPIAASSTPPPSVLITASP